MLDGRQTVLLRKGGIGEKRFDLAAGEFVFFPMIAHGHADRVRPEHHEVVQMAGPDSTQDHIVVRAGAKVVAAIAVNHPDGLDDIADTHIWTAESVRADRLDFRPKHRLTVLVVQARALVEPVRLPRVAAYAGCTSWVDLPLVPQWADPVHDDATLASVVERVCASVG